MLQKLVKLQVGQIVKHSEQLKFKEFLAWPRSSSLLIGVNVNARGPTKKMTLQFTKTREGTTVRVKTETSATIWQDKKKSMKAQGIAETSQIIMWRLLGPNKLKEAIKLFFDTSVIDFVSFGYICGM